MFVWEMQLSDSGQNCGWKGKGAATLLRTEHTHYQQIICFVGMQLDNNKQTGNGEGIYPKEYSAPEQESQLCRF